MFMPQRAAGINIWNVGRWKVSTHRVTKADLLSDNPICGWKMTNQGIDPKPEWGIAAKLDHLSAYWERL